jgi:hypothetical protein
VVVPPRQVRIAHESHIFLLLHERSHPESEQQAAKDFRGVEDGEPCFPATETAFVSRVPFRGALSWENIGFESVGVVEEDR